MQLFEDLPVVEPIDIFKYDYATCRHLKKVDYLVKISVKIAVTFL